MGQDLSASNCWQWCCHSDAQLKQQQDEEYKEAKRVYYLNEKEYTRLLKTLATKLTTDMTEDEKRRLRDKGKELQEAMARSSKIIKIYEANQHSDRQFEHLNKTHKLASRAAELSSRTGKRDMNKLAKKTTALIDQQNSLLENGNDAEQELNDAIEDGNSALENSTTTAGGYSLDDWNDLDQLKAKLENEKEAKLGASMSLMPSAPFSSLRSTATASSSSSASAGNGKLSLSPSDDNNNNNNNNDHGDSNDNSSSNVGTIGNRDLIRKSFAAMSS